MVTRIGKQYMRSSVCTILCKNSMGLDIYVDPAGQGLGAGKLAFTLEKYAVVPTRR